MIDPNQVTNAARTGAELEEFLLFCVVVAGKNADQQARKLEQFLAGRRPFEHIRSVDRQGRLAAALREVRLGKYTLLVRSFRALASSGLDLGSCPWEELTRFPGIGMKTAKFFVLHSRAGQMHGVLDTHVLGWMRERWGAGGAARAKVPRHSPQDTAAYGFWETVYFGMVTARFHGQGPAAIDWAKFDLDLWKERRGPSPA
jgi:endonuclease III